ncbi:ribonuclease P protein component [Terriglobus tenax]|uniref:ribonuclease P protein component n=1 Tax=Terriglobus tenax TaxID=1111115 RepID=UPI0021DFD553|nr:ribonuclease P protein component [Terriglobus tenax]
MMHTDLRLRKHADYQSVYGRSRKQHARQMAYFFAPREDADAAGPRVGLTVGKVMGKAHDRNRIKRRMRAAVQANAALLTMPVDVILHPRRTVLEVEFEKLKADVADVFRAVQRATVKARA